nr:alpha/beta hydrolase [uncultured Rhodopila sp.]
MQRDKWLTTTGICTSFIIAISIFNPWPASAGTSAAPPALQWQACQDAAGFDCATAHPPLDYADPDGKKIDLAVIRHAATDQANRIGTLFFNPGGPGGSGTEDLPQFLDLFPAAVRARFDIVSWDPRGVGQSTAMQCFPTLADEATFFDGVPTNAFPVGYAEQTAWFARFAQFADICLQQNGALLSHMSTTDTARDLDLLREAVGDPKIRYLGASYGTFLGAVYANLFPDRVGGLILDGNLDPEVYTNYGNPVATASDGVRFGSSESSAKSVEAMLDQCGVAGPAKCAFSTGDAAGTRARYETLLKRLKVSPQTYSGIVFTYALVVQTMHNLMFTTLPEGNYHGWPGAAKLLNALWTRDPGPPPAPPATDPGAAEPTGSAYQGDAVECSDSPNPRPPEVFRALSRSVYASYGPGGLPDLWNDESCASWQATAADAYIGPWNKPTANPILVIGNTNDPSTPYQNSVAMSQKLARARLLTVQGYGHTVWLNPSSCASQYEADYLINGTLPPEGTICQQDAFPFQ